MASGPLIHSPCPNTRLPCSSDCGEHGPARLAGNDARPPLRRAVPVGQERGRGRGQRERGRPGHAERAGVLLLPSFLRAWAGRFASDACIANPNICSRPLLTCGGALANTPAVPTSSPCAREACLWVPLSTATGGCTLLTPALLFLVWRCTCLVCSPPPAQAAAGEDSEGGAVGDAQGCAEGHGRRRDGHAVRARWCRAAPRQIRGDSPHARQPGRRQQLTLQRPGCRWRWRPTPLVLRPRARARFLASQLGCLHMHYRSRSCLPRSSRLVGSAFNIFGILAFIINVHRVQQLRARHSAQAFSDEGRLHLIQTASLSVRPLVVPAQRRRRLLLLLPDAVPEPFIAARLLAGRSAAGAVAASRLAW